MPSLHRPPPPVQKSKAPVLVVGLLVGAALGVGAFFVLGRDRKPERIVVKPPQSAPTAPRSPPVTPPQTAPAVAPPAMRIDSGGGYR